MSYRYPLCRDLDWVINTPPLYQQGVFIDSEFLTEFASPLSAKIRHLDQYPTPAVNRCNRRLGSYYEHLWLTLLHWHPDYHVLAHDLIVAHQQRTLGALDLVVHHLPTNTIEHWELAIKFYLNDNDGHDPMQWLGPGRKDSLGTKLERMLTKQLPLSTTTQAKQLLRQRGWKIDRQRVIMQGRLYQSSGCEVTPPKVDDSAPIGRWFTLEQLPERQWHHLNKRDWLGTREWRLLPRWEKPRRLVWPQHLFDPVQNLYAFVVPDDSEWHQKQT